MSYFDNLGDKAIQLAQPITDKGLVLRVDGYSLLKELISEATSQLYASKDPVLGTGYGEGPLYRTLSDAVVADLSGIIQRVSNLTFNVAQPIIKGVLLKMQQVMNPDITVAYSSSEVCPVIYDPIWDSALISDLAHRGRNSMPARVSVAGSIRSLADEAYADLAALAMTGVKSVDEEIQRILSGFTEQELRQHFNGLYMNGWLPQENPLELITDWSDAGRTRNLWIIIACWTRNLLDIPPAESAFDLGRYKMTLTSLEELCNAVISGVDELRQSHSENDLLILRVSKQRVVVNNDLYIAFLRDGGTPEAVLGVSLIASNYGRQIAATQLKSEQDQYEKAWARHVQISSINHGETMNAQARRQLHLILDGAAAEFFAAAEGETQAAVAVRQGAYQGALTTISNMINALPADFTRDTHRWVFDIVSEAFFPGSDVGRMLKCLREVGDIKDSGFSAEVIRVIAVVNFVADWQADITRLDIA